MKKQILFFWISIFIIFLWQFFYDDNFYKSFFYNYSENHISNFLDLDEKILIEWKICWEVDKRIFKTNYVICVNNILKIWNNNFDNNSSKNIEWKILISTSLYPEYLYWDNLQILWKLKTPFENEDFSYKNFLLKEWIFWYLNYWKIEKINFISGNWNFYEYKKFLFFQKIFQFKKIFLERIEKIYPAPHSAFLAGLLIGDRKWLPDEIKQDFQKNWLAHIVAISWYNITIIIILISWIFFFLPRKIWIILSVFFIILFTIFVWW